MSEEKKMSELKLPSGKTLRYNISTFDNGDTLYRTILEEIGHVDVNNTTEIDETLFIKIITKSLASKKVKDAVWACFDQAVIDGDRLTKDYFEPAENREDYIPVFTEITKANLAPFWKSLCAQLLPLIQMGMKFSHA